MTSEGGPRTTLTYKYSRPWLLDTYFGRLSIWNTLYVKTGSLCAIQSNHAHFFSRLHRHAIFGDMSVSDTDNDMTRQTPVSEWCHFLFAFFFLFLLLRHSTDAGPTHQQWKKKQNKKKIKQTNKTKQNKTKIQDFDRWTDPYYWFCNIPLSEKWEISNQKPTQPNHWFPSTLPSIPHRRYIGLIGESASSLIPSDLSLSRRG